MKGEMDLNLVRESRERIFPHFLSLLFGLEFYLFNGKTAEKLGDFLFCVVV